jgi:hypothetical protein
MRGQEKEAKCHCDEPGVSTRGFIGKFSPDHQRVIRTARKALRQRLPTPNELVYGNDNFFVIGYSPTERPSDTIVSLVAGANGVGLSFYRGATCRTPVVACWDPAPRTGSFGCLQRRCFANRKSWRWWLPR